MDHLDDLTLIMSPRISRKLRVKMKRYYDSEGILRYKQCSNCGDTKETTDYYPDTSKKDGYHPNCKTCQVSTIEAARQDALLDDPTRFKGYRDNSRARLRARTPEEIQKDRHRLRPTGDKKCNTCKKHKKLYEYYDSATWEDGLAAICISCDKIRQRERYRKSSEKYWLSKDIPLDCYICQEPYEDIEHVVPRTLEGKDTMDNKLPSCFKCNRGLNGKYNKPLLKWLQEHRPGETHSVLTRVLSYGVSPWTYLDTPEEISTILTELEQYQTSVL